jgi:hypothetical protein
MTGLTPQKGASERMRAWFFETVTLPHFCGTVLPTLPQICGGVDQHYRKNDTREIKIRRNKRGEKKFSKRTGRSALLKQRSASKQTTDD